MWWRDIDSTGSYFEQEEDKCTYIQTKKGTDPNGFKWP